MTMAQKTDGTQILDTYTGSELPICGLVMKKKELLF